MTPELRPGTWDDRIWREVAAENEYGLPAAFAPGAVVLDIGAHTGAFTYAALQRGAGPVVAVEAHADNFPLLHRNIHGSGVGGGRAVLIAGACWRSDLPAPAVLRCGVLEGHTGNNGVHYDHGPAAVGLPFDAVLEFAARLSPAGRVRLVKMDCEGSEWPCLLTSRRLDLVDELVGEIHLFNARDFMPEADDRPFSPVEMHAHLHANGFAGFRVRMTIARHTGLFHAWRADPCCDIG